MISKLEVDKVAAQLQSLWCDNLRRFGIECLLVDDYTEMPVMLNSIARKSRGSAVYVTGSHLDISNTLAVELGQQLALLPNLVMVDGQSDGVSRQTISAFMEASISRKADIHKRLKLFANPYATNPAFSSSRDLLPTLKAWRASLMRSTQVCIFFDGGMGTEAEVEAAQEAGCSLIPVPGDKFGLLDRLLAKNPKLMDGLPSHYVDSAKKGRVSTSEILDCLTHVLSK